jgi:hypothetical protein
LKIEITFNLSSWKWYADGMKGNLVMVVDFVVDLSCQINSVSLSLESRRVILCFYSVLFEMEHIEIVANTLVNVKKAYAGPDKIK